MPPVFAKARFFFCSSPMPFIAACSCFRFFSSSDLKNPVNLLAASLIVLKVPITPFKNDCSADIAVITACIISTASIRAKSSTLPPAASIPACILSLRAVASSSKAGASAPVSWSRIPLNKKPSLLNASFASSTPFADLVDITMPSAAASPIISCKASLPKPRVLTRATPSESNSFMASLTLSAELKSSNALDSSSICSSSGSLSICLALMPNSLSASFASPVPLAASAVRLVKRCKAMSIVVEATPVRSAA